jgi:hypothetical protein
MSNSVGQMILAQQNALSSDNIAVNKWFFNNVVNSIMTDPMWNYILSGVNDQMKQCDYVYRDIHYIITECGYNKTNLAKHRYYYRDFPIPFPLPFQTMLQIIKARPMQYIVTNPLNLFYNNTIGIEYFKYDKDNCKNKYNREYQHEYDYVNKCGYRRINNIKWNADDDFENMGFVIYLNVKAHV